MVIRSKLVAPLWVLALTLVVAACQRGTHPAASGPPEMAPGVPVLKLAEAIERSARYLAGLCDERGQFIYRTNLDPAVEVEPSYNEVRHAGAVYALAQCCERSPDPAVRAAMLRAAAFMRKEFFAPVAGNPRLRAAFLSPDLADPDQPRQAKLGGTALGLVALLSVEQIAPDTTPREELQALARFLIFMQKPDGSFYSKYFPETGRDDTFESQYFPGEAALGLLMLYDVDPAPQWLRAAAKALDALARRGATQQHPFPDQWFLLAAERMIRRPTDTKLPMSRTAVLDHARRICTDMLSDQKTQAKSPIAGCFTDDGRSCPTATRLEGLLAARRFLPADQPPSPADLSQAIDDGLGFLLRCQITEGPHSGALTRVMPGSQRSPSNSDGSRAQEVRIDYVQHALSVMIRYEAEGQPK